MPATDVDVLEGGNAVGILEASVEDGYHHSLTSKVMLMQLVTLKGLDLLESFAVDLMLHSVMLLEAVMIPASRRVRSCRVRREPYQFVVFDAGHMVKLVNGCGVF